MEKVKGKGKGCVSACSDAPFEGWRGGQCVGRSRMESRIRESESLVVLLAGTNQPLLSSSAL